MNELLIRDPGIGLGRCGAPRAPGRASNGRLGRTSFRSPRQGRSRLLGRTAPELGKGMLLPPMLQVVGRSVVEMLVLLTHGASLEFGIADTSRGVSRPVNRIRLDSASLWATSHARMGP